MAEYAPAAPDDGHPAADVSAGAPAGADTPELSSLLATVMRLPKVWVAAMTALAVVASIDVSRTPHSGVSFHVAVGAGSFAAVALIWLPALLRLLSLTGGRLKAAGVEATTSGLLRSPDELIGGLAKLRTEAERAERETPEASALARDVQAEVDRIAAGYLSTSATLTDAALTQLARDYEQLRARSPRSPARMEAMTQIVNEVRVRAHAAPATASLRGIQQLHSHRPGDRIVGLALLQEAPITSALPDLLTVLRNASTAFELYHVLVALEHLRPLLSTEERQQALDAIAVARQDRHGIGIASDPYLPAAMGHVSRMLSSAPL